MELRKIVFFFNIILFFLVNLAFSQEKVKPYIRKYDSLLKIEPAESALSKIIDNVIYTFHTKDEKESFIEFTFKSWSKINPQFELEYAKLNYKIANFLYTNNYLFKSYEYIDKVSTYIEGKDLSKIDFAARFYLLEGNVYYKFYRFQEGKKCIIKSIHLNELTKREVISAYNSLGLIYRDSKLQDSAIYYFKIGLKLANKYNAADWRGIIIGNLGYTHFVKGDISIAKKFLIIDKNSSLEHGEVGSAANALISIVRIDLLQNDEAAIEKDMKTLDSLNDYIINYGSKRGYYQVKMLCNERKGDYKKALDNFKLSVRYGDSLRAKHNQSDFKNLEFQIQFEKKQAKTKLLIEKQKRIRQSYYSILLILVLVLITCIFFIYQLRKRRKREREILELKNQHIQKNLESNKREMNKLIKNIAQKNSLIETLQDEIQNKEEQEDSLAFQEEKLKLHEKIQSFTLLTEEDLIEFRHVFNKIYPGFYDHIVKEHPNLTKAEVRLIMLLRLNISTFEIAQILGISEDSVRRTNHRVRKKLEIESQNDLISYIFSIQE